METSIAHQANQRERGRSRKALRFVILIGILSFFADFTYEGSRSILGPFLLGLGASATVVGIVTGFGELLGYALRVASGRWADMSGKPWPITIIGYVVQMSAVPALALVHTWHSAAVLIVLERVGKAIRNPPRDVMLSYAASDIGGYGWAFGIHEALDQFGAMVGPLLVAVILALKGSYQLAFTVLLAPALVNVILVLIARSLYPVPLALQRSMDEDRGKTLPREYWVYLAGASLVAAGFADYPLIAFHLSNSSHVASEVIAALYASAMAVSGAGALVLGRLFDRFGFAIVVCLTLLSTLFAPMVFLGSSHVWWVGGLVWGIGMGFHESIIPAAVSPMAPPSARASAFGMFTASYGVAWFAGSSAIGILYDASKTSAVIFCVISQLLALPFFLWVWAKGAGAR